MIQISRAFQSILNKQYPCPKGMIGHFAGELMVRQHAEETIWTVSIADIQPTDCVLEIGFGAGKAIELLAEKTTRGSVAGIDLSPIMVKRARKRNAQAVRAGRVTLQQGDAAQLPFEGQQFDKVITIHIIYFWSNHEVILTEMLRVLKPEGTIAFSTWPPELFVGTSIALSARYMPAPPQPVAPPSLWGDPNIIRQRLGNAVRDIVFDRACLLVPALSPQHFRANLERSAGPMVKLVQALSASDPERLNAFRREFDAIVAHYFENNLVRQDYLLTRATKV